ncbi:MAG: dihydrolipoamide acetyltransferase family protein [Verrucomicrobiales bacterium]
MDLKLPELGEDIEEATVLKVLVSEGDRIEAEQSVIEVETDKATLEVPADSGGTVESIEVGEGDSIKVGQVIAKISEGGGGAKEEPSDDTEEEDEEGEEEKEEEKDKEKDKDREVEETAGEEEKDQDKEKDKEVGETAGDGGEEAGGEEDAGAGESEAVPSTGALPVFASPSVRRFAREIGIDLGNVEGSGPGGRLSVEDVKRHARETRADARTGRSPTRAAKPLPDLSQWGEVENEEMSKVRRVTADRMSQSWTTVPHVTLFEKADVTELEEARGRLGEEIEEKSAAGLSLTAMLVKIVAIALEAHPRIAGAVDIAKGRVVRRRYSHIGVAVDTGDGLVVPVLRDVIEKSLPALAEEWGELSVRAREGKLSNDEMRGGVFTLTNLGMLGTGFFTPLVNLPEGAILGVGRSETEPVYEAESEEFVPRLRMPLSLSFDHRFIDGADGARFLHWLVQAMEDPFRLALEVGRPRKESN